MPYRPNRRPYASRGASNSAPTDRQKEYLAALIEKSGQSQEDWREAHGLYEHSPWGKRLRTEMITRASMSRWIDELKSRTEE